MKRIALLAAILLAALACDAGATTQIHDANNLWIVPEESGWGLNLFHQGDTLFASLFVYGPDGRAKWYTASSLTGSDGGPLGDHPALYSGPLYETTGPAIGGPFDPSRVTRRQVGTMTIELGTQKFSTDTQLRNYAMVYYSIDGVQVSKKTYPFSFVRMGLTGSYRGYEANWNGFRDDVNINVSLNGDSFAMTTTSASFGSCTFSGRQEADGSLFHVEGSYTCNSGQSGNFTLKDVDVTRNGFTASFGSSTIQATQIAAQRTSSPIRGDGYNTDLWWVPAENGWGLNIIEEGDVLFGTLFVYDAAGEPHWYSASDLTYSPPSGSPTDSNGVYTGALYESTGPYFGTSFNAAAVTRRQVGTMRFESFGNNTAYLDYTADGVTVTHKQLSRAAFRTNTLAGTYAAHILASQGFNDRGVQVGAQNMTVSQSGDAITVTAQGNFGTCTMRGTVSQYGRQAMASGPYDCGGPTIGQLQIADVYPTLYGFTGTASMDGYPIGRIEGVRTTPP
jgi:hypothetical protein